MPNDELTFEERMELEQLKQRWRDSKDGRLRAIAKEIDQDPVETQRAILGLEQLMNKGIRLFYELELEVRDGNLTQAKADEYIAKLSAELNRLISKRER
jgi:nucleotidyltransferase/DNA polymerase involved in DNA repair